MPNPLARRGGWPNRTKEPVIRRVLALPILTGCFVFGWWVLPAPSFPTTARLHVPVSREIGPFKWAAETTTTTTTASQNPFYAPQTYPPAQYHSQAAPSAVGGSVGAGSSREACIIAVESGGDPNAYNPSGAWGLYQFMPGTYAAAAAAAQAQGLDPGSYGSATAQQQQNAYNAYVNTYGGGAWQDGC